MQACCMKTITAVLIGVQFQNLLCFTFNNEMRKLANFGLNQHFEVLS